MDNYLCRWKCQVQSFIKMDYLLREVKKNNFIHINEIELTPRLVQTGLRSVSDHPGFHWGPLRRPCSVARYCIFRIGPVHRDWRPTDPDYTRPVRPSYRHTVGGRRRSRRNRDDRLKAWAPCRRRPWSARPASFCLSINILYSKQEVIHKEGLDRNEFNIYLDLYRRPIWY